MRGALALGNPKALAKNDILLANGALELSAEQLQAGALTLSNTTAAAEIRLGDPAEKGGISFRNSADQTWSGSLIVKGDLRRSMSIRFGTDQTALTQMQIQKIRHLDPNSGKLRSVLLDSKGWLKPTPESTLLLLR